MKIVQVNATYNAGSTGTIMSDIHKLLLKNGFESYVAYSTTDVDENDIVNGYKIGGVFGKKVHALLSRIGGRQGYFSRYSTKKLISFIKSVKPDIVHLHNLHSNYINLNMLLEYLGENDIRTVITLHDCWFFTGGCFCYSSSDCFRWLESCGNCPRRYIETPAYLYDASAKILKDRKRYLGAIKNLDVVGVSNWVTSEAKRSILSDKNVLRIYNGIDVGFFKPILSDLRDRMKINDKFIILGFANKWLKSINRSLLEKLCSFLKDDMVFLLVGGEKPKGLVNSDKIITLPFINSREEMREVYSSCDVFANCTREDTFSLVNAESQACGTPVVTFSNTGAKETVSGEYGIKVKTGDINGFLSGIETVYKNGKQAYSAGCVDFVKNNFDKQQNYLEYLKLYIGGDNDENK